MRGAFILLVCMVFLSCGKTGSDTILVDREKELASLSAAVDSAKQLGDTKERLNFWLSRLKQHPEDSVLRSKIHYNIAGVYYGRNNIDSMKWHMQEAWNLMALQQGFAGEMVQLNSGEGNIARLEQRLHEANYYYNRAAQQLTADTSADLSPKQKVSVYLAAAQSDAELYQYKKAVEWNEKALGILRAELPDDLQLLNRAYSQLALSHIYIEGHDKESLQYIDKLGELYARHQKEIGPRFFYDRKTLYFDKHNQFDSVLVYQLKLLAIDAKILETQDNPTNLSNVFKDYANIASAYTELGKADSAKHYLDKGASLMKGESGSLDKVDFILFRNTLIRYLFIKGRYKEAYQEYKQLIKEYREIYQNEYAQAIAEMATVYELKAKEKSIVNLNERVESTESRLRQNKLLLIITGLSALLAIMIATLLYFIQKQRKLQQINEQVEAQKNAIELEQRLLRTQMEPHFIFNTLSALQSYVRLDEKEKSLRYLNHFSRLLRSSLELSRESLVPLNEEIETLENYLSLQQMRYDNGFTYEISGPEDEEQDLIFIPPMLIQPFVENAIIHGIQGIEQGRVTVSFELQDDTLTVVILDNGAGIDSASVSTQAHKKSLSTTISRERLAMLSREKDISAGIVITDRSKLPGSERGTQVILTVPVFGEYKRPGF